MNNFQRTNTIAGWVIFAIALIVYSLTLESTVSFWDCGEFISSAFRLEIVHPPGAPLFAMVGRIFTLFSPDNAAWMINFFSGLASAFCILFVFWSVTYFGRKLYKKTGEELDKAEAIVVLAAGAIAGLSATFLDSFWFSAVEGEVYAFSAFFGFAIFWAMLKWDAIADDPASDRWLIFIALLTGLGVGVHLLHLLSLPAIAFVYYFRKYEPTWKGGIITFIIGFGLLAFMMFFVLDYFVKFGAWFDHIFVNSFGLPFLSGVLFYILLAGAISIYFTMYAIRTGKRWLQVSLLSFLMIMIGFSSYTMVFIRAKVNPPINMNKPADPHTLYSYLKREQYGSRPLIYGPYFTAEPTYQVDKGKKYIYDEESHKYIVAGKKTAYKFDVGSQFAARVRQQNPEISEGQIRQIANRYRDKNKSTIFPRMGAWMEARHQRQYRAWLGMGPNDIPDFSDNIRFFFKYQINYMYWRYFMWNFSGRQDDVQGHIDRGRINGNWITGIGFIDNMLVGDELLQPESMESNARNKFFMLPFILGLIGFIFHFKRDWKMATVILVLFFYTGFMNIINSNEPPSEPRERDYALAISFVTYAMWIGMGVIAIFEYLRKKMQSAQTSAVVASVVALIVPVLLAAQGWDDHDRSGRYLARDSAIAYLESVAPNAVLFTQGDNDTYPLWYIQEVEGIRPDVRIINLSLLAVDWYIDQLHNKINDAPPLKLRFNYDDYLGDGMISTSVSDNKNYQQQYGNDLNTALNYLKSQSMKQYSLEPGTRKQLSFPIKSYVVPVDSTRAANSGAIPEKYNSSLVKELRGKINKQSLVRDELILLDIIASNFPERPIYYSITVDRKKHLGLGRYMQMEGMAYRLVPVDIAPFNQKAEPFINTDIMYKNITEKWQWGGMDKRHIHMDLETGARNSRMLKQQLINCAQMLSSENKNEETIQMLNLAREKFPIYNLPIVNIQEYYIMINTYLNAGGFEEAASLNDDFFDLFEKDVRYNVKAGELEKMRRGQSRNYLFQFFSKNQKDLSYYASNIVRDMQIMNTVINIYKQKGQTEVVQQLINRVSILENELNADLISPDIKNG
jgi:Protein O-mannosyl-transferase TMEM260-like